MAKRKEKKFSKEEQERIIESYTRQLHIDIKRALTAYTILFLLKMRAHYAFELIAKVMEIRTLQGEYAVLKEAEIPVAPKVIYDNFRKLEQKGIVGSYVEESAIGPDRKYYYLTKLGERLFEQVVVNVLYPRLWLFIIPLDRRIKEWGGGPSKKKLNKLLSLIDEIFSR